MLSRWLLFVSLLSVLASCSLLPRSNSLATGEAEDAKGPVNIPINPPGDLNFKSKSEVLQLRSQAVNRHPSLLRQSYIPNLLVFGPIEDHRPWWGMQGTFIWGAGPRSIEGMAEESRFLLNPFLLVGANSGTALIWDKDKISESDLKDKSFPYCWLPESLRIFPSDSLVQVTYNISAFNKELSNRKDKLIVPVEDTIKFGLIAYNARDFGFNYIYLDPLKSMNITPKKSSQQPTLIKQMIHCGNSCQYPGGCNNMSPAQPDIDEFDCSQLPARANIRLWKWFPLSKDSNPDLTVFIDLR
ncbi:MAG: hypothetical protein C5B53_09190 [Candidatus Melainabacteria bacterium]|nr:MAG: hypothetical protein C5B53_09190 [Candidatus Melainabacteria bacterium]